jgi:hypothetical protein
MIGSNNLKRHRLPPSAEGRAAEIEGVEGVEATLAQKEEIKCHLLSLPPLHSGRDSSDAAS